MPWDEDEVQAHQEWLRQERQRNLESYPEDCDEETFRYCHQCGELLRYNSMAYWEGFHFDSCE